MFIEPKQWGMNRPIPLPSLIMMGILALVALLAAACTGPTKRPDVAKIDPTTGEVQLRSDTKDVEAGLLKAFPDLPIPADHKVDLERSVIFTSPNQTVGKLTTQGGGDVDSLYNFYITQLPQQGWKMVNAFQSSTSSLYFSKNGRFVAIIIEPSGLRGTRVTLNVGPE